MAPDAEDKFPEGTIPTRLQDNHPGSRATIKYTRIKYTRHEGE